MSVSVPPTIRPAIVIDGQATVGAFQHGAGNVIMQRLQDAGFGAQPFDIVGGSSSGTLIGVKLAEGGEVNHDFTRNTWIENAQATRIKLEHAIPDSDLIRDLRDGKIGYTEALERFRDKLFPHRQALQSLFDRGIVNAELALKSKTQVVVNATRLGPQGLGRVGQEVVSSIAAGLSHFSATSLETELLQAIARASGLVDHGFQIVTEKLFTNKKVTNPTLKDKLTVIETAQDLINAIKASTMIPFLYGAFLNDGDVLIDGAFSNNAPLETVLQLGATDVFAIAGGAGGKIFDQPFQNIARRCFHETIGFAQQVFGHNFAKGLQKAVDHPRPVDIKGLEKKYDAKIHVIHSQESVDVIGRFFETRENVIGDRYDNGRRAAEAAWDNNDIARELKKRRDQNGPKTAPARRAA